MNAAEVHVFVLFLCFDCGMELIRSDPPLGLKHPNRVSYLLLFLVESFNTLTLEVSFICVRQSLDIINYLLPSGFKDKYL